jgi:hypothetical protein
LPAGEGWPVSFCLLLRPFHPGCLSPARAPEYKGVAILVQADPVLRDVIGTSSGKSASGSKLPSPWSPPHFVLAFRRILSSGSSRPWSTKSISLRSRAAFLRGLCVFRFSASLDRHDPLGPRNSVPATRFPVPNPLH